MTDWSEEKAREWLDKHFPGSTRDEYRGNSRSASLAALLEEVAGQECPHCGGQGWYAVPDPRTGEAMQEQCNCVRRVSLAEVRRVVEEELERWETHSVVPLALHAILSRLEKL